jgi:hypothetical protein
MERLVVITNEEPSIGHVWTLTENDVFRYQETIAPNTWALEIENLQLQKTIEDLAESSEKFASKTNDNDNSLIMNLCKEHDSHQMILVMPTFAIDSTPIN